jgi:hypothetical protein
MLKRVSIPLVFLLFAGCGAKSLYDWGSYQESVGHMYASGEARTAEEDRSELIKEIDETIKDGKRVPPGKFAQAGYLCYLAGDKSSAAKYFKEEKKAFPESAQFMDDMLRRLQ